MEVDADAVITNPTFVTLWEAVGGVGNPLTNPSGWTNDGAPTSQPSPTKLLWSGSWTGLDTCAVYDDGISQSVSNILHN